MLVTTFMWHPAGEARQYEAAGSRTSYSQKWNPAYVHNDKSQSHPSEALLLMLDALCDKAKVRWLDEFETSATVNERAKPPAESIKHYQ